MIEKVEAPGLRVARARCPYCHEDVERREELEVCIDCHAFHHLDCWTEGGAACSACGLASSVAEPEGTIPCSSSGCERRSHQLDKEKPHCARHESFAAFWALAGAAFFIYLGFDQHLIFFLIGVPLALGFLGGLVSIHEELRRARATPSELDRSRDSLSEPAKG